MALPGYPGEDKFAPEVPAPKGQTWASDRGHPELAPALLYVRLVSLNLQPEAVSDDGSQCKLNHTMGYVTSF